MSNVNRSKSGKANAMAQVMDTLAQVQAELQAQRDKSAALEAQLAQQRAQAQRPVAQPHTTVPPLPGTRRSALRDAILELRDNPARHGQPCSRAPFGDGIMSSRDVVLALCAPLCPGCAGKGAHAVRMPGAKQGDPVVAELKAMTIGKDAPLRCVQPGGRHQSYYWQFVQPAAPAPVVVEPVAQPETVAVEQPETPVA